jgi:hypothetical protein
MIPGASSLTTLAPKPNSYCGAAFVTLGGSVGVSTFAATQTVCSKLQKNRLAAVAKLLEHLADRFLVVGLEPGYQSLPGGKSNYIPRKELLLKD